MNARTRARSGGFAGTADGSGRVGATIIRMYVFEDGEDDAEFETEPEVF